MLAVRSRSGHDAVVQQKLTVPVLIITVGLAWLLNTLNVVPDVDWVWSLGLMAAGVLTLTIGGITKTTLVVGPLLLVGSVFSVLRQTGRLQEPHEIPLLVILLGALMLWVQLRPPGSGKEAGKEV